MPRWAWAIPTTLVLALAAAIGAGLWRGAFAGEVAPGLPRRAVLAALCAVLLAVAGLLAVRWARGETPVARCPDCGFDVGARQRVCPVCGTRVNGAER